MMKSLGILAASGAFVIIATVVQAQSFVDLRHRLEGKSVQRSMPELAQQQCIDPGLTCTKQGLPCCGTNTCQGTFPNMTCQSDDGSAARRPR